MLGERGEAQAEVRMQVFRDVEIRRDGRFGLGLRRDGRGVVRGDAEVDAVGQGRVRLRTLWDGERGWE